LLSPPSLLRTNSALRLPDSAATGSVVAPACPENSSCGGDLRKLSAEALTLGSPPPTRAPAGAQRHWFAPTNRSILEIANGASCTSCRMAMIGDASRTGHDAGRTAKPLPQQHAKLWTISSAREAASTFESGSTVCLTAWTIPRRRMDAQRSSAPPNHGDQGDETQRQKR